MAPGVVIPEVLKQVQLDINAKTVGALTETDIAIWRTPEGTAYVDGEYS